jgi:hypothetical protein
MPPHDAQEPIATIAAALPLMSSSISKAGRPANFM